MPAQACHARLTTHGELPQPVSSIYNQPPSQNEQITRDLNKLAPLSEDSIKPKSQSSRPYDPLTNPIAQGCALQRIDDAITKPEALAQIPIRRPVDGARLVASLKAAATQGSVTEYRREQKAPVSVAQFQAILDALAAQGIVFRPRESAKTSGSTCSDQSPTFSGTLTYYGNAATFNNHDDKTKIRMRIRYYIEGNTDSSTGEIQNVRRSKITEKLGFVELKVKNPRPGESGFVDKYRMMLPDKLVYQLIHLDPTADAFATDIATLRQQILALNSAEKVLNKPERVHAMLNAIAALAKRDPRFLKPHLVVSYARDGYAFQENYPITVRKKKSGLKKLNCLGSTSTLKQVMQPIEYQLTVDRNISAHLPLMPQHAEDPMPVAAHFDPRHKTEILRYPENIRVLEFKQPKPMALLPKPAQSAVQQHFSGVLLHALKTHRAWGDFATQTGKYGTFRAHLKGTFEPPILEKKISQTPWQGLASTEEDMPCGSTHA